MIEIEVPQGEVLYDFTNETLESVIGGLSPQPEDRVLSVAGSGDQALALLEYTSRVVAVDNKPWQMDYFKRRVDALRNGDYDGFRFLLGFRAEHCSQDLSASYFDDERLGAIRRKLDRLTLVEGDIFDIKKLWGKFNKVYLSNALDHTGNAYDNMSRVAKAVNDGGLVYLTEGDVLFNEGTPSGFVKDHALTKVAVDTTIQRVSEFGGMYWDPAVYRRKVENKGGEEINK